ncbi:Pycsar system effector family protein [Herbaspirillum sp. SJZ107]|uniref:Pycsar system effector family protein n=1 Tax=Herbaspirillum sp. SJZ107 TaxID=2572881 RepID=UPI0011503841|nr:Pycsar system effector family protein [Herbaspirillum sp. SJZ107]TQK10168.1 hypothetical protein FBX97_0082 [Herbaspirillum sp. SJZ107]
MENTKDRLVTAQWVFERQLAWIAAAEVKLAVVIAIDTALLGGLAAAYSSATTHTHWTILLSVFSTLACSIAMFCVSMAVLPRLQGPSTSLLFFGKIRELDIDEYSSKYAVATDQQLLEDWTAQIHRNADIACLKHIWVRRSVLWSFIAAPAWIIAIGLLVKF